MYDTTLEQRVDLALASVADISGPRVEAQPVHTTGQTALRWALMLGSMAAFWGWCIVLGGH